MHLRGNFAPECRKSRFRLLQFKFLCAILKCFHKRTEMTEYTTTNSLTCDTVKLYATTQLVCLLFM